MKNKNMNLDKHLREILSTTLQVTEACGPLNSYYFGMTFKRPAKNMEELILFYIEQGGAIDFDKRLGQIIQNTDLDFDKEVIKILEDKGLDLYFIKYHPVRQKGSIN